MSHPPISSPLTPLSTIPTPTSSSGLEYTPSFSSSSSSIISRQSSCRSTTSVQAVPFKSPIRGPLSGNNVLNKNKQSAIVGGGGSGGGVAVSTGGNPYFSAAPMMRKNSNGGNSNSGIYPLTRSSTNGSQKNNSKNNSSVGLALESFSFGNNFITPSTSTSISNSESTNLDKEIKVKDDKENEVEEEMERTRDSIFLDERPIIPRAGSSNLSNQPAIIKLVPGLSPLVPNGNGNGGEEFNAMIIRKTPGDFKFGEILGEGSYSTVSLVTDKFPPYKSYALKVLDKDHIKREKKTKYVLIERDTLKILDGHPGIVRLYWTFQDARSLYYVLELAKNGELLKWIKKFGSFSVPCAKFYSAQILSAVEHIHSKNVIHRDLKPENILLDEHMRVKITDFGTAKLLLPQLPLSEDAPRQRSRSFVGTPEYVSPEILSEKKESSRSSDFWAIGCIIYQILAGHPPFQAKTEYLMFQKIISLSYTFPLNFDPIAKDLVTRLLILDPLERLGGGEKGSIEDIKNHSFFEGIDWDQIWECDVPELETGINEPKEIIKGEFVMPVGLDGDSDEEEEEEEIEKVVKPKAESLRIIPEKVEVATKWSGILLPTETILCASPILDKTGFITKKRTLILTDYPRLICIKETSNKVTLKSEIFVGVTSGKSFNSSSSTVIGGGVINAKLVFSKVILEGEKVFSIKTNGRTFKYEEPSPGGATRWVSELTDAHSGRRQ